LHFVIINDQSNRTRFRYSLLMKTRVSLNATVHRFQQYLFHIQIQNSRDFKKSTPQYVVSGHF